MIEFLHKKEVARVLRTTESTLDRWHEKSYGPRRQRMGGRVVYSTDEVTRFLQETFGSAADPAGLGSGAQPMGDQLRDTRGARIGKSKE